MLYNFISPPGPLSPLTFTPVPELPYCCLDCVDYKREQSWLMRNVMYRLCTPVSWWIIIGSWIVLQVQGSPYGKQMITWHMCNCMAGDRKGVNEGNDWRTVLRGVLERNKNICWENEISCLNGVLAGYGSTASKDNTLACQWVLEGAARAWPRAAPGGCLCSRVYYTSVAWQTDGRTGWAYLVLILLCL